MQIFFKENYPTVVNQLLKLPEGLLNKLFTMQLGDVALNQMKLDENFWKTFAGAVKSNKEGAMTILTLLNEKTPNEVEKLLKKLQVDLLFFLSERGAHTFDSEERAINFFTGRNDIDKDQLLKLFKVIDLDHNKDRDKGKYDWDIVKPKVMVSLSKTLEYPNASFVTTIDVMHLSKTDFLVAMNPTNAFLTMVNKHCVKAIIVLLANYGEDALSLPSKTHVVTFDVLMEKAVLIKTDFTSLPPTGVKASLFIPNAPMDPIEKMKFFSKLAKEKQCRLGTIISAEELYVISKLCNANQNALIYHPSDQLLKGLLFNLKLFDKVTVMGDNKLKAVVTSQSTTPYLPQPDEASRDHNKMA